MEHKARLILNWPCGRSCELCCNDYESIMALRKPLNSWGDLRHFRDYDAVMLSGGDPLLMRWKHLEEIIRRLRQVNVKRIYLYTTWWNSNGDRVVRLVDGIHFSLHPDAGMRELALLKVIQEHARAFPKKSFRLFVDAKLQMPEIDTTVWSRVEHKHFMTEQELIQLQPQGIPEGEELYVFMPTAQGFNPPRRT